MDIVILTNFARNFSDADNDRFTYIANMLSKDNNVEVITSDFFHSEKRHRSSVKQALPYKVTFIHEPGYKRNISPFRFFSHFVWGKNVQKYLAGRNKPDVIYCAVPSLTGADKAMEYCGEKSVVGIIDIQDLWPEAFKMVFGLPVISDIVFSPFKKLANRIYNNADGIVAVSQTYADRALSVATKVKKAEVVYLGTDLELFDTEAKSECTIGGKGDELWLAYCGTLGSSYDIKCVIDALKMAEKECVVPVKFIVMGNGPLYDEFKAYAFRNKVDVLFTGRIPYSEMCAVLHKSDIVINPIVAKSAATIINKHADYAASGLPVINTQESDEYRKLVERYEMGFNCDVGNSEEVAKRLIQLVNNKELRIQMGKNSRKCAEEMFDRRTTYCRIRDIINKAVYDKGNC